MEKRNLFAFLLIMAFTIVSCTQEPEETSTGDNDDDTPTVSLTNCACASTTPVGQTCTGSDGTTQCAGTDAGNNNGGGNPTGSTCAGTTADGTGSGLPIHHFTMMLAGHQSWMPGTYGDPLASAVMPTVQEAGIIFRSDSRLKVRLKVNSQPYPTAGEEYCYGRNTGSSSDQYNYTKLRFRLHLRDIMCDNPDPVNPNNCLSGFYLGNRYRTQYISPVSENLCTPAIDIGALRNQTQFGTVIEVDDVKADSTCQANGTFCPAEKIVRAASCWHMTLQVVTDYTQDFGN